MKKFFLTTPIYYPNARPHVGSAYTTIVCDVLARYKRMCGYDVAFLTGTDEHGEKLRRAAEEAGVSPAEFVAEKRKLFTKLWKALGIPPYSAQNPAGYRFVHTSQNPDHVKSVHWMIRQAQKAGYIEKRKYEGRYCVFDERYVSDSTEPATCDICGRPAELISEENYFFRLSAFEKPLLELYERHEKDPQKSAFVQPDYRLNEVRSFVRGGLRDISISRKRLKWGIPWPDDPEQVVYVWYDALTSYLTGIDFRGLDETNPDSDFHKYWMDPETEIVHMIGKDILRFHAVYWPAFLMAAGLPLPKTVFAHGWIYYEQDKMSKSKGNVLYPEPIVEALDSFGAPGNDALRYYLLREAPFGQDMSFSYEGLIQRYNSDLANDLGNLANRTITMLHKYFGGEVPAFVDVGQDTRDEDLRVTFFGQSTPSSLDALLGPPLATDYKGVVASCAEAFDRYDFSNALANIWNGVHKVNTYLVIRQPWTLAASAPLLSRTLYRAADLLRTIAVLVCPAMPKTAERLWKQLGCGGEVRDRRFSRLRWAGMDVGTKVGKPEPIFPRLDKEKTLARLEELAEADRNRDKAAVGAVHEPPLQTAHDKPKEKKSMESEGAKTPSPESQVPTPEPQIPTPDTPHPTPGSPVPSPAPPAPSAEKISIDDFAKVEMRTGEVKTAERVPGATKLLKLTVDIGTEIRQVVAGIAEYYEPEKLVGMKVVIVTNLQPRKLRGVESNGMIVAASVGEEGRPVLVTFKEDVPNGARLK